jgi:hypothetical protein
MSLTRTLNKPLTFTFVSASVRGADDRSASQQPQTHPAIRKATKIYI